MSQNQRAVARLVRSRGGRPCLLVGGALDEADLAQLHSSANADGECPGNDFGVELAFVTGGSAIEFDAVIGDQAGENVEAAGRAFRIRLAGNVVRRYSFM